MVRLLGLVDCRWVGVSAGRRRVERRGGSNQTNGVPRRVSASCRGGEHGQDKKRPPLSFPLFLFIACRYAAVVTYDTAPNYRVLLSLWYAVP